MNFLGWSDFLQFVVAIITLILGIISGIVKLKSEDGKWKRSAYYLIILLVISTCASIALSFKQAYDKYNDTVKSTERHLADSLKTQENFEKLYLESQKELLSSTNTLKAVDESLNNLQILQFKTNHIIDSISHQLSIQRGVSEQTNRLVKSQQIQFENSERLLNPVYPFHLFTSFEYSFSDPALKYIIDSLIILKKLIEVGSLVIPNSFWTSEIPSRNEISRLSILDYDKLYFLSSFFSELNKSILFGFITDTLSLRKQNFRITNSILSCRARLLGNSDVISGRKSFCRLIIDYERKQLIVNRYFTDVLVVSLNQLNSSYFGLNDLENAYVWFDLPSIPKVNAINLYFGKNFNSVVNLNINRDNLDTSDYTVGTLYFHSIKNHELMKKGRASILDNYKIYYYDKGTQSLGMPDPF